MSSESARLRAICATLHQVTERVEEIIATLPGQGMPATTEAAKVRRILSARLDREQYFDSSMFGEPAWDGLLELYLADVLHQPMTVTGFCTGARASFTTGLRIIDRLYALGVLERAGDPRDKRKSIIRITPAGRAGMATYLATLN